MEYPFINPVEILQQRAQDTPDLLSHMLLGANEEENQSLTYSQLDHAVREMAAYLQSVAEPGQRALLVYPTSLDFIIAMYACLYAGIVPIPTNPPGMNRSAQRLEAIARDAQATLVLTTPEYQADVPVGGRAVPGFCRAEMGHARGGQVGQAFTACRCPSSRPSPRRSSNTRRVPRTSPRAWSSVTEISPSTRMPSARRARMN